MNIRGAWSQTKTHQILW